MSQAYNLKDSRLALTNIDKSIAYLHKRCDIPVQSYIYKEYPHFCTDLSYYI